MREFVSYINVIQFSISQDEIANWVEISELISPIDVINTTIHEIGHALTQYVKNVILYIHYS